MVISFGIVDQSKMSVAFHDATEPRCIVLYAPDGSELKSIRGVGKKLADDNCCSWSLHGEGEWLLLWEARMSRLFLRPEGQLWMVVADLGSNAVFTALSDTYDPSVVYTGAEHRSGQVIKYVRKTRLDLN